METTPECMEKHWAAWKLLPLTWNNFGLHVEDATASDCIETAPENKKQQKNEWPMLCPRNISDE